MVRYVPGQLPSRRLTVVRHHPQSYIPDSGPNSDIAHTTKSRNKQHPRCGTDDMDLVSLAIHSILGSNRGQELDTTGDSDSETATTSGRDERDTRAADEAETAFRLRQLRFTPPPSPSPH